MTSTATATANTQIFRLQLAYETKLDSFQYAQLTWRSSIGVCIYHIDAININNQLVGKCLQLNDSSKIEKLFCQERYMHIYEEEYIGKKFHNAKS